jgi:hypothetical protein
MNEPPLERIRVLERSVKHWRVVSLVLALLLICALAIGGLITTIPANQEPGRFWTFCRGFGRERRGRRQNDPYWRRCERSRRSRPRDERRKNEENKPRASHELPRPADLSRKVPSSFLFCSAFRPGRIATMDRNVLDRID